MDSLTCQCLVVGAVCGVLFVPTAVTLTPLSWQGVLDSVVVSRAVSCRARQLKTKAFCIFFLVCV